MTFLTSLSLRAKLAFGLGVLCALFIGLFLNNGSTQEVTEAVETAPIVETTTAAAYAGQSTVSLIGTVRAFSEAAVTAERAGRVTSVPVRLGQSVAAGQIIATLENASERASVLQAEGSYDAAVAAAAQSDVGSDEAATRVVAAQDAVEASLNNAYNTTRNTVVANIDQFFSNPDGFVPGLRISGRGNTARLNNIRIEYQTLLPNWQNELGTLSNDSDLDASVAAAKQRVNKTIEFVDIFLQVFVDQGSTNKYSEQELAGFSATFAGLRSSLVQSSANLDSSLNSLRSAQEALNRANLAGTGGQNSAADAQVKQALGSLRAAQANLAKTVLRSPIAGTVNTLAVRTGDFIGGQQQIAEVANNNALEIVTSIGEQERDAFAVGDTVIVEDDMEGTVTEVAPAIDPRTGKIELRIAAASVDLQNGDTVTITRQATTTVSDRVFVPLSAIKFEQKNGNVFVVKDNTLVAQPVTTGTIRGGSVEVTGGLSNTQFFVRDARGLQAGTVVEVAQ